MANENTKNQANQNPDEQAAAAAAREEEAKKAAAKQAAKPAPTHTHEKFYRVVETHEVPHGGGSYLLKKGKVISSKGYHIDHLKRIGVKLEEASA